MQKVDVVEANVAEKATGSFAKLQDIPRYKPVMCGRTQLTWPLHNCYRSTNQQSPSKWWSAMGAVSYLATSGYCMSLNHPKFGRPNEANLENILKRSKTFLNENLYQPHKIHKGNGFGASRTSQSQPGTSPATSFTSSGKRRRPWSARPFSGSHSSCRRMGERRVGPHNV